jgi:hypothetical protein
LITINTESGSTYVLDTMAKTWARTKKGELLPLSFAPLRTTDGTYTHLEDIEVGKRGTIYGPGLEFGVRWIHTSKIISVEETIEEA